RCRSVSTSARGSRDGRRPAAQPGRAHVVERSVGIDLGRGRHAPTFVVIGRRTGWRIGPRPAEVLKRYQPVGPELTKVRLRGKCLLAYYLTFERCLRGDRSSRAARKFWMNWRTGMARRSSNSAVGWRCDTRLVDMLTRCATIVPEKR